jgi:hypothetical protein
MPKQKRETNTTRPIPPAISADDSEVPLKKQKKKKITRARINWCSKLSYPSLLPLLHFIDLDTDAEIDCRQRISRFIYGTETIKRAVPCYKWNCITCVRYQKHIVRAMVGGKDKGLIKRMEKAGIQDIASSYDDTNTTGS